MDYSIFPILVQNSFDVMTILRLDGVIDYVSPSVERVLGYSPSDFAGRNAFEMIHPEDVKSVREAFESVVYNTNYHVPTEFRARHRNGAWIYLEAMGNNLVEDHTITGVVLNLRDITERKAAKNDLTRLNAELTQAYDATLEGWSRALDLRDNETEGHTRRVIESTLQLARHFGISESELTHIRRGALLHDIGKIGIPDRILFKRGALDAEEMTVMRRHPIYAYEILSPIRFLQPALDIPYCHHEKWDGNGYPRGLSGVDIPFTARLFAVIDVWDALLSNRPYRPAWSREQALVYISSQAGRHFDPAVVSAFMALRSR